MNLKCFIPVDIMNFTEEKSFFKHENILYMKFVDTGHEVELQHTKIHLIPKYLALL